MSNMPQSKPKRDLRHEAGLIVMTLAAVLLMWFVIGNSQRVQVHFWIFSAETSLITVILISAVLGAVIALLLARANRRKSKS